MAQHHIASAARGQRSSRARGKLRENIELSGLQTTEHGLKRRLAFVVASAGRGVTNATLKPREPRAVSSD